MLSFNVWYLTKSASRFTAQQPKPFCRNARTESASTSRLRSELSLSVKIARVEQGDLNVNKAALTRRRQWGIARITSNKLFQSTLLIRC